MRYEDVQKTPHGLKILLGAVLVISIVINMAVLVAIMQGNDPEASSDLGWLQPGAWLIIAPLIIMFTFFIFTSAKMWVWVDDDEIRVRMRPFHIADKHIRWSDVKSFEVRDVSPFGEFGGWGIRWNPFNGKTGYIWGGKDGVELTLNDGKRVVITVADGDELRNSLAAIQRVTTP